MEKDILKWLDARIICPIIDNLWVNLIHCVSKKGEMTVLPNQNNELIPSIKVNHWRLCMDYRKLNKATRKDHFPFPYPPIYPTFG